MTNSVCFCADRYVILGGHRDAWVFGGIDPMSGAAVAHESVRSAGRLLSRGKNSDTSLAGGPLRVLTKPPEQSVCFVCEKAGGLDGPSCLPAGTQKNLDSWGRLNGLRYVPTPLQ